MHLKATGFTIVEVMVSLAIFAISAVVLGAAYANTVQNLHNARTYRAEAGNLRLMRALIFAETDPKKVARGGRVVLTEGETLNWSAQIESTRVADLFQVHAFYEDLNGSSDSDWKQTETFMALRPTWSDPEIRDRLRAEAKKRLDSPFSQ